MNEETQQDIDDQIAMNWLKIAAPALAVWYTDTFLLGAATFIIVSIVTMASVWFALLRFGADVRAIKHIRTAICILAFVCLNAFGTH